VRVGHAHDLDARTGCTVVLFDPPAVCGVDVRGGAPGTRETDVLAPTAHVEAVHAVLLAGGSAYGLEAASGVAAELEARGVGYAVGPWRVPIVPAAIIFDLLTGDGRVRPDRAMGIAATRVASAGAPSEGAAGVGAGALVAKLAGIERARRGGVGCALVRHGELRVGALAVCNAIGNVVDPATGETIAAPLEGDPPFDLHAALARPLTLPAAGTNTTLAVVATNARLRKVDATRIAAVAHDGFARAVVPAHLTRDGDAIFACGAALDAEGVDAPVDLVAVMAAEAVAAAIVRGVRAANASRTNLTGASTTAEPKT
jgi:L-aminopeptidase/D-esterase-like protein